MRAAAIAALVAAFVFAIATGSTAPAATTPVQHVILVMEENHSSSEVTASSMPYLTSLGAKYAHTTELSPCLPSLPNYIDLVSGSTGSFCGTDCSPSSSCQTAANNIFHQAGSAWHVWAESEPVNCDHANSGEYAVRHTAAPYFTDIATACKTLDTPYPSQPVIGTKRFMLIAPNLCNDAHDCSLATADNWLKVHVGYLLTTPRFRDGSTLIEVTFDSGGPNNRVYTALLDSQLSGKVLTGTTYTHNSLLRLNEELLGFPLLAGAATAPDMRPGTGL